jgi:hypothetical protein
MSALGQKRTLKRLRAMSALPPKADIGRSVYEYTFRLVAGWRCAASPDERAAIRLRA